MNLDALHLRSKIELSSLRNYGIGTWAVLIVLLLLLTAAGVLGYLGWTSSDNSVPESGYVALPLGVLFSLAVGVGLMALLFYSSRAGYDEPAVLVVDEPDADHDRENQADLPDK
jgi:hypothetical protein